MLNVVVIVLWLWSCFVPLAGSDWLCSCNTYNLSENVSFRVAKHHAVTHICMYI